MTVRYLRARRPELYRHCRADGDRGMVTVFTALAGLALLLMVGLVVDGGDRMRAVRRADRVAGEAARAAVEAADTRGRTVTLDRPVAVAAASAYLRAAGVAGTVTVTGPRTVHVEVSVSSRGTIALEVTGSADAGLSIGVEGNPRGPGILSCRRAGAEAVVAVDAPS